MAVRDCVRRLRKQDAESRGRTDVMNVGAGVPALGLEADEMGSGEGPGLFLRRIGRSGTSKLPLKSDDPAEEGRASSIAHVRPPAR